MISRDWFGLSTSMHGISRFSLNGCRFWISLKYGDVSASSSVLVLTLWVAKWAKMQGSTQPSLLMWAYHLAAMQPPTSGASPQKSRANSGRVSRTLQTPSRNSLRSSGVSMRLMSGSRPMGMYMKFQPIMQPLATRGSTNSGLMMNR